MSRIVSLRPIDRAKSSNFAPPFGPESLRTRLSRSFRKPDGRCIMKKQKIIIVDFDHDLIDPDILIAYTADGGRINLYPCVVPEKRRTHGTLYSDKRRLFFSLTRRGLHQIFDHFTPAMRISGPPCGTTGMWRVISSSSSLFEDPDPSIPMVNGRKLTTRTEMSPTSHWITSNGCIPTKTAGVHAMSSKSSGPKVSTPLPIPVLKWINGSRSSVPTKQPTDLPSTSPPLLSYVTSTSSPFQTGSLSSIPTPSCSAKCPDMRRCSLYYFFSFFVNCVGFNPTSKILR